VSLAQARAQREAARTHVAEGRDPGTVKQEERRAAKIAAGNSFEAVARDWFETQRESWTDAHAARVIASLEREVFPVTGSTPIADIRAPAILDLLRKVEARGVRVVTVANGQSTITAANISQVANAPILPTDLPHAMQQSGTIVGVDSDGANAYEVSYSPAITALTDGKVLCFRPRPATPRLRR